MKINFRKILSLALAAFVAFGTLGVGTLGVNATTEDWFLDVTETAWTGSSYWIGVYDTVSGDNGTITSATSSNTAVFDIAKFGYDGGVDYNIDPKAAGTATLTVNFTTPSGEAKTLSKNVVVKAYPKEIKSLKVNGKKVNTNKYKFFYNKKMSKSKTSVKIKMALKKGWKITNIYADRSTNGDKYTQFKVKKSALKNGKAMKFGKKYKYMWINVTMKKGNDIIQYTFDFYR